MGNPSPWTISARPLPNSTTDRSISLLEVTLLGDGAALVNFENSLAGSWQGKPFPQRIYVTEIWLKRDGKWRQRLYQETPVAPL